ncbi:GtrA family protein [Alsobacter sp. R-9]
MRAFVTFALVGAIAFFVDVGVLLLVIAVGVPPLAARAPSFLVAVAFTWLLNRRYTFSVERRPTLGEFGAYIASQASGALTNLSVYAVLVWLSPFASRHPAVAVAVGSISGLVVNFFAARLALETSSPAVTREQRE